MEHHGHLTWGRFSCLKPSERWSADVLSLAPVLTAVGGHQVPLPARLSSLYAEALMRSLYEAGSMAEKTILRWNPRPVAPSGSEEEDEVEAVGCEGGAP
jgi:hypothetical protein